MAPIMHTGVTMNQRFGSPLARNAPWDPIVLTVVGGIIRAFFFFISDNAGGDAIARAASTQNWMNHHSLFSGSRVWLPPYFWISGPMGHLAGAELGTRLLSLLSGTLTIYVVYKLTERLAGPAAAGISALVCVLSGLHIGYSTTSSSEALFVLFLLTGIWLLFEFQASNRWSQLVLGSLAITVSCGIRYEAWVFLPLLGVIFVNAYGGEAHRRARFLKRGEAFLVYALLAGAWPIFWMLFCWVKFDKPLYIVSQLHSEIPIQLALFGRSRLYSGLLPVGVLLLALSPIPAIGAAYSAIRCWGQKAVGQFLLVAIGFGLFQEIEFVRGGGVALARYMLTCVVLGAVLSGIGIVKLAEISCGASITRIHKWVALSLVSTLFCILVFSETSLPFSEKFASVSPRLRYPRDISKLGKYLGPRLQPGDALIVDDYHWDGNIVEHALGLPLLDRSSVFRASFDNTDGLENFIRDKHPRYLVYAVNGNFQSYWGFSSSCPYMHQSRGLILKCVFSNQTYRGYELQYP